MKELKMVPVIVVVILASTFGVIAFVAIWPYLDIIGKMLVGLCAVAIGCAATSLVAWTWQHWRNHIIAIDGVVVLIRNGQVTHLSAEHERAKVPLMLPSPVTVREEDPESQKTLEENVREVYSHGTGEETIAKSFGITRHQVRKILGKA